MSEATVDDAPKGSQQLEPKLMEIGSATSILESISSTSERELANLDDMSLIGGHGPDELSSAFLTVIADLQKKSRITIKGRETIIHKDTPYGMSSISIYHDNGTNTPESVELAITSPYNALQRPLSFELPVIDYGTRQDLLAVTGFRDTRTPDSESAKSTDLQKRFTPEKYQLYLKGMRWFAKNILAWNERGFFLPEEVDKSLAQISSNPTPLLEEAK